MFKRLSKNNKSARQAVSMTWSLMTSNEKLKAVFLSIGAAFVSLIDVIALVGVVPLVGLIIEPETLNTNQIVNKLFIFFGEPEFNVFVKMFAFGSISLITLSVLLNLLVIWLTMIYRVACQDRLAGELISICVNADYHWLLNQNSTKLTHYVSNDVLSWSSGGIHAIIAIVGHSTLLLLTSIVVINLASFSGLVGIFIIGLIASLIMILIRPKITELSLFRRSASAKSFSVASEFLSGIKDIKLSGRENTFINNYLNKFNIYGEAMGKLKVLQSFPPLLMLLIGQSSIIIIALVLWSSGLSSGEIASQVTLVLLIIGRAVPVITRLSGEFATLWNSIPNLEGIHKVINEVNLYSKKINVNNLSLILNNWNIIKIKNIDYQFEIEMPLVISDLSLKIRRGKSYGVVGPTGSGKTTLIDLILGLLIPSKGEISIDEIPLDENCIREWQNKISYVPQNPTIIDGTLIENVCLGVPVNEINRENAVKCLKDADLGNLLNEVSLDGRLGESGKWLSGGQRQRVCIARALYNNPEILILDEATSSLDTISENAIKNSLINLGSKITIIMIAHRIKTIRHCDEIFVIDQGKLKDKGDYSYLEKNSTLFKKLILANN